MTETHDENTKYVKRSISFTQQQNAWLDQQKNASLIVRSLVQEAMNNDTPDTPETRRAKRLEAINNEIVLSNTEITELFRVNKREFKGCETRNIRGHYDNGEPYYYEPEYHVENPSDPTPITKKGEIVKAQINVLRAKIAQLTKEQDFILNPDDKGVE